MRIGIVGLGLGGATAAAALHRYGADVTVFEQAPEIREVGAGIATWPNTIRLLRRLGLEAAMQAIGTRTQNPPVRTAAGDVLHRMSTESYDDTPGYCFHRAELLNTIAALVPANRVKLGRRCIGAREEAHQVELRFDNDTSEVFDVVIAADGIKSTLLGSVVAPSHPKFSNLVAYRGLVPNTPDIALDNGNLWTNRERYLVAFPVSGGTRVNFAGFVPTQDPPEESWFMQGSRSDLAAEFAGWDPVVGRIIAAVTETFRWGVYFREPLPRITSRRIALLGDAAHPMLPHAGQGVGQAIEDAFALGEILRDSKSSEVPDRLAAYEALRLPRATAVQSASRANAEFLHKAFPIAPGATRPERASPTEWIINYDVVSEANRRLDELGSFRAPS
jgi:salicylate hydroxylase